VKYAFFVSYQDIAKSPSPCFKETCAKARRRTSAGVYISPGATARRRAKLFTDLFRPLYPDDAKSGPVTYVLKDATRLQHALNSVADHGVCLKCWHRMIAGGECKHCGHRW
jgi:hypothetical protein